MSKIKRLVLIPLLASVSFSTFAGDGIILADAGNTKVRLKGGFDFNYGHNYQKHLGREHNLTLNQKRDVLYSEGNIRFELERDAENDYKYGAKIVITTTTNANGGMSANGSHIWVSNDDYGKVEVGSPFSAARKMHLSAGEVDEGTGLGWCDYIRTYGSTDTDSEPHFRISDKLFIDSLKGTKNEPTRKVSYYTPEMAGFQAGLSYTPDTKNVGDHSLAAAGANIEDKNFGDHQGKYRRYIKNLLSYGLGFKKNLADGVDVKLAYTGEYSKSTGYVRNDKDGKKTSEKLGKLQAHNIGAYLGYGNFGIAGSYGTLGKSAAKDPIDNAKRRADFYTMGASYRQGPAAFSLTHFNENHHGNKMRSVSLATSYEFMKGLKGMVEITKFHGKGRYKNKDTGAINWYKPKGYTLVTGLSIVI